MRYVVRSGWILVRPDLNFFKVRSEKPGYIQRLRYLKMYECLSIILIVKNL